MAFRSSSPARPGFVPPPSSLAYRNIAIVFLVLTVVVVVGALWISSVAGRIVIKAKKEATSVVATIDISKTPDAGGLHGRVVQGTFEKIQEFTVNTKTASSAPAPTSPSVGTVKIVNNYSKSQTLVEKTRLITADGKLYRIKKRVTIEPKQSASVEAVSDQTGPEYAMPAGTKLTIPGLWPALQPFIYAESVTPFGSGSVSGKVVTSDDITNAQKTIEEAVMTQAEQALRAEAAVPQEWKVTFQKKVLDTKTNTIVGASADSFIASEKVQVTAVFYSPKDLEAILRQKLTDKLPEGRELVNFNPSTATLTVTMADSKSETAQLTATADAVSRLSDKSSSVSKAMIQGLTVEDATNRLKAVDGVESVEIKLRPTWVSKLPTSPDRIEFIVE